MVYNVENNMKNKPSKRKNKVKMAIILGFAFLIYCIYLLIRLLGHPMETFIVEQGKIYKEESVTGYILRDEQVVENEVASRKNIRAKGRRKKSSQGRSYI